MTSSSQDVKGWDLGPPFPREQWLSLWAAESCHGLCGFWRGAGPLWLWECVPWAPGT